MDDMTRKNPRGDDALRALERAVREDPSWHVRMQLIKEQIRKGIPSFRYSILKTVQEMPDDTCETCDGDQVTTCLQCTPDGTVVCTFCGGEGTIELPPDYGEPIQECPQCEGAKELPCPACDGTGDIECATCEGTGEVHNENYPDPDTEYEHQEEPADLGEILDASGYAGDGRYIQPRHQNDLTDWWDSEPDQDIRDGSYTHYSLFVEYADGVQLHPQMRKIINDALMRNYSVPEEFQTDY